MLHNILFTEYNRSQSVLHLDDERHFIISNDKRAILENMLKGCDDDSKDELFKLLAEKGVEANTYVGLQEYQMKVKIIPAKVMNILTKPFLFLFYDTILCVVFTSLLGYLCYELFLASHTFLSTTFAFNASWLLLIIMFVFHEIGHASACKHYGAPIYDVGFGIAAFRPVLYANVTGAWYLNQKERLIVNIGGVYFQIILSSITTFLSIQFENSSLFYLSRTMLISVFFQFYPFYRSDGYWIISDIIGEPHLYKKAIAITSKKIRNWKKTILTPKELCLFIYLMSFECVIMSLLLFFIYNNFSILIRLPQEVVVSLSQIISGDFHRIETVSFHDIWVAIVVFFIAKFVFNTIHNRKRSANGATVRSK